MTWPDTWPDHVRRFYAGLASRFGWPAWVIEGVAANVEYLRRLTDSAGERRYFSFTGEESTWLYETVEDRGELVVIRQVEVDPAGAVRGYGWQHREDEHGMLTEQPITPEDEVDRIDRTVFDVAWRAADC